MLMRRYAALALLLLYPLLSAAAQDRQEDRQPDRQEGRVIETRVVPVYPELAKRMNLQGVVRLQVSVSAEGYAHSSVVIGGNPVLAKAAQDTVLRWKWAVAAKETKEIVELKFQPR
jgi:TonB family protein